MAGRPRRTERRHRAVDALSDKCEMIGKPRRLTHPSLFAKSPHKVAEKGAQPGFVRHRAYVRHAFRIREFRKHHQEWAAAMRCRQHFVSERVEDGEDGGRRDFGARSNGIDASGANAVPVEEFCRDAEDVFASICRATADSDASLRARFSDHAQTLGCVP